ncbi:MAG: hypothetical protein LBV22_03565 [Mycoplasmataceae bacterium]|nr:hypothetical protein [Mycoplasmataceae bacterium]
MNPYLFIIVSVCFVVGTSCQLWVYFKNSVFIFSKQHTDIVSKWFPNYHKYISQEIILTQINNSSKANKLLFFAIMWGVIVPEILLIVFSLFISDDSYTLVSLIVSHTICTLIIIVFPFIYFKFKKALTTAYIKYVTGTFQKQTQMQPTDKIKEIDIKRNNHGIPGFIQIAQTIKNFNVMTDVNKRVVLFYRILYSVSISLNMLEQRTKEYTVVFNGTTMSIRELPKKLVAHILP